MKTFFAILLVLVTTTLSAQIPNSLKLTEKVMSIGTVFSSNSNIKLKEDVVTITPTFVMYDNSTPIAKARERIISIGNKIDVTDANNNKIGSIQEELFTSWGFYSRYNIYDENDKLVAKSEKHKYLTTEFVITDTNGNKICTIKRPAINIISDEWTLNFINPSFDKRLIVFIPCYKTYYDNHND